MIEKLTFPARTEEHFKAVLKSTIVAIVSMLNDHLKAGGYTSEVLEISSTWYVEMNDQGFGKRILFAGNFDDSFPSHYFTFYRRACDALSVLSKMGESDPDGVIGALLYDGEFKILLHGVCFSCIPTNQPR